MLSLNGSGSLRRRLSIAGSALLMGFALLGTTGQAVSDVPSLEAQQLRHLSERVRTLEHRIEALEKMGMRDERAVALEDTKGAESCAFPYEMAAPGVLRLKTECIAWSNAASCVPPYSVDERGVREINPQCQGVEQLTNCDPPFVFDKRGVKIFLPGCSSLDDRH